MSPLPPGTTPWPTPDPFLFCVHHRDQYPAGDARLAPRVSLEGRQLGSDFAGKDGWSMYHGRTIPGFPQHPHRGFETVTVVREGLLDHSDSMGAAARYGQGDVQWLTAGAGIQHAEMFPLLKTDAENPFELFQIWLNLPRARKMVRPHFKMLWSDSLARRGYQDQQGKLTELTLMAGKLGDLVAPVPPPDSWAADPANQVNIWTLKLSPRAQWTLPPAPGSNRTLYFFSGQELGINGVSVPPRHYIRLTGDGEVLIENGAGSSELLLLGGRPIAEPIARRGPFVMNTEAEIRQAYADYRATQFGGWPWSRSDPHHGTAPKRFARHADGQREEPS
ncbi:MAG: pirin family protein [Polyangiaceae bacterium]|nr:pirin family protein [Polyangiaceae bacterium]